MASSLGHFLPDDGDLLPAQGLHPFLDPGKILGSKRGLFGKIVIKSLFDSRADGQFNLGE